MEAPIGFVSLRQAADAVGRKLWGPSWRPLDQIDAVTIAFAGDPHIERVIRTIAEHCAAGEIAAVYPSNMGGVEPLECDVWTRRNWRTYFSLGTIELELPRFAGGRPAGDGSAVKCTREIFVRQQDTDRAVETRPAPLPKQASFESYKKHQDETKARTGRWASRDQDIAWARENNYVIHHARDDLRRKFKLTLSNPDQTQFERAGRRK